MKQQPQNIFSVDLEDWYQGIEIDMQHWEQFAPRIREGLDRLLDLLAASNTKATFFVLGYQAEKTPDIIRQLKEQGHDIASHGYSHRFVYQQTPKEFQTELRKSKQILEDLCGVAIEGYRAPYFSITAQSRWALDILLDEGFLYDSSLFPINNYRYGMPGANRAPGWLRTDAGNHIYEIPLSTVQLPKPGLKWARNLPMSGGGYFRLYPYALSALLIKRLMSENQGLVFYMHPWEYDPAHPRVSFKRRLPKLTHYLHLRSTANKTRKLLADFEFTTIKDAYSECYQNSSARSCS